jgi:MoaA/NifB/PqqE/SkfB family radical SAM enzyme
MVDGISAKARLLWGLLDGEIARGGPLYVNVDATHRCNLRCHYCRWHSPLLEKTLLDRSARKDIEPAIFDGLCEDLAALGTRKVQFVGAGEPMLHPAFFDLVRSANRRGLELVVYTNGTRLAQDDPRQLVDSGLDLLRISLADPTADAYAARHPYLGPGAFDRLVQGITRLAQDRNARRSRTPVLEMCVPIDRENMGRLDELVKLARTTGVDRIHFSVVLDFDQKELATFTLDNGEVVRAREHLRQVRPTLEASGMGHNIDDVLLRYQAQRKVLTTVPCYSAWFYSMVDTDGRVRVCQRSTALMGDLGRESFRAIWNGPAYRGFRKATRGSNRALGPDYDCDFCPHLANNHRVHTRFRWLAVVPSAVAWLRNGGR